MLGPATCRHLDRAIAVSLEDLVPTDHVCRHLEATAVPDVADVYLDGITYLLDMLLRG